MSWAEALENINYLGVALGALASLVIGAAWYAPQLFGKQWAGLIGFKKKDVDNNEGMPVMMTMSIVFYSLVSLVISALLLMTEGSGPADGLMLGIIVGFVFGFGPTAVTYGFARRSFNLTAIDGGYVVVTTAVIGLIAGLLG